MCGRYYRTADKSALQDVFKAVATGAAATYAHAYNISPHSIQLAVRQGRDSATREIVPMRWGLIGRRTKGPAYSDMKPVYLGQRLRLIVKSSGLSSRRSSSSAVGRSSIGRRTQIRERQPS